MTHNVWQPSAKLEESFGIFSTKEKKKEKKRHDRPLNTNIEIKLCNKSYHQRRRRRKKARGLRGRGLGSASFHNRMINETVLWKATNTHNTQILRNGMHFMDVLYMSWQGYPRSKLINFSFPFTSEHTSLQPLLLRPVALWPICLLLSSSGARRGDGPLTWFTAAGIQTRKGHGKDALYNANNDNSHASTHLNENEANTTKT